MEIKPKIKDGSIFESNFKMGIGLSLQDLKIKKKNQIGSIAETLDLNISLKKPTMDDVQLLNSCSSAQAGFSPQIGREGVVSRKIHALVDLLYINWPKV